MIPKIIHFVWIGHSPKSDLIIKCIDSWRRVLPDYEIIEWDNEKFRKEIRNEYAQQAFQSEKWAFASDYIRLYALYNHGGFYFDSDLEVTANLDKFRDHAFFSGFEAYKGTYQPITALMAAEKGNPIVNELLSQYDDLQFLNKDGSQNLETNTLRITKHFESRYNLTPPYTGEQSVDLDLNSKIYPSHFFCTPVAGKPNYSIHHFNGSWAGDYARRDIIRAGSSNLSVFKHRKQRITYELPIKKTEQLVLSLPIGFGLSLNIVKNKAHEQS